jgi:flagellar biosynthesis GTPase FlhF
MKIQTVVDQVRAHKLATAIVGALVIVGALYFGSSLITGIREAFQDAQVNRLNKQSEQKEAEAQKSLDAADKEAVDRAVEDKLRELNIEPQRRQAKENSEQARQRATKAETDYENARKNINRNSIDERLLHERNCADLHELYPGERVAGCEP